MTAILKKELRTLFLSPMAYMVMGVFFTITGYLFVVLNLNYGKLCLHALGNPMAPDMMNLSEMVIRPLFDNLIFLFLILVPMLTMRSFTEEKKMGTVELLYSYPLTDWQLIGGKLLGILIMAITMVGITFIYPILLFVLAPQGGLEWGMIFSCYGGVFLLLLAFVSLGIWASSLTDNLVISYLITFGSLLFFWIIGWMDKFVSYPLLKALSSLSLVKHTGNFYKGVINTWDIGFFLLFSLFFLFLTYFSLESRKYY